MKANTHHKYLLVGLGLVLLVAFWMPSPGKAQGITFGSSVPDGQIVDQNLVLRGSEVTINGTVNGDVLAIGQTITVIGQVNGSLLAVGETITVNGQVTNNLLAGGVTMLLDPNAQIGRDLYFGGARLTLAEGADAQRDVNCISLEAQFSGAIGRDLHATIGPMQIAELILVPLRDRITLTGAVNPEGIMQADAPTLSSMGAGLLTLTSHWSMDGQKSTQQTAQIDTKRLKSWGIALLRNLIALLALGLLGIWLYPAMFNWTSEMVQKAPWRMALSGLTFYLGGWFVAVIGTGLVVAFALFFYTISLPNLGFLLGTLGLTGLGLGVSVFWFSIAYGSKLIIALLIGRLILERFAPRYAQGNLWPLILGVVLYVLVASIPYLGWVVATLVTFFGLGALWVVAFQPKTLQPKMEISPAMARTD